MAIHRNNFKLGIARQTLSKWENGQAVPELSNLISLSNLYGITIDRIVKEDDCGKKEYLCSGKQQSGCM